MDKIKKGINEFAAILPRDQTGLKVRRNIRSGIVLVELDYIADPSKRSLEWKEKERRGIPAQEWNREMERSFINYGGKPVYMKVFNRRLHIHETDVDPDPSVPLIVGWDSGGFPAAAICQYIGNHFTVLDEIYTDHFQSASLFIPYVYEYIATKYPFYFLDVVDPAAFDEGKTVDQTRVWVSIMINPPYNRTPIAGEKLFTKRRDGVIRLMSMLDDGVPRFMVNPRCKFTIAGMSGGYQYPEKVSPKSIQRPDRPLKNEFSHIQDAIQYAVSVIDKLNGLKPSRTFMPPANRGRMFSFQKG